MNIITEKIITIPTNYTFSFKDSPAQQTVTIYIDRSGYFFNIWTGSAYVAAGDYTQTQLNTAVQNYLVSKSVA